MSTPNPATSPWVPLWDLNGGVNLNYRGAYVAATQYIDGDIVILNGIAYMCVRPTLNPPAVWPMAPGVTAYGTSLPASPYDGQEAVLVDSVTNSSYTWRFRYNAQSTSAYKWEFVGGNAWQAIPATSGETTSSLHPVLVDLASGPSLIAPRAGDYFAEFSLHASNNTAGQQYGAGPAFGSAGAVANADLILAFSPAAGQSFFLGRKARLNGVAAGDSIRIRYCAIGGGTANFERRHLQITPVRVS